MRAGRSDNTRTVVVRARGAGPRGPAIAVPAFVIATVACAATIAGGGGQPPAGALRAGDFVRDVAPFPVLDAAGEPYEFPFLGGMNTPRPQFVDIDADGDYDLFVQEYGGDLWYFENSGSPREARFTWRTARYQGLDVGEWNRFVDVDADGDLDIVAELPYSYVRLFRNTGTPARATFVADPDSMRDASGAPLFVDRQNIPAFADLDCNDRLDMIIGRVDGAVTRYEAVEPRSDRFGFVADRFEGIEIIGTIDSTGTRHGANALFLADGDRDGDPDLYWGDFFEPGVLFIENIGPACRAFSFDVWPVPLPGADSAIYTSGYNAPLLVDLDDDGDLDFLMGVLGGAYNPVRTIADNFYHFERVAPDRFELRTRRFLNGIDVGSESAPAAGDLDGDGDLDLLVGTRIDPSSPRTAKLLFFRNAGSRTAPSFRLADTLQLDTAYHYAPALGDLDADGDLDLMLGTWNRNVEFYRNEGSALEPRFVRDTTVDTGIPRAGNATPALVDIDGDGDLDLVVGEATGAIRFARNTGTATHPRFELVTDRLGDIDVGRRSAPAVIDLDGDGLHDLVVGLEGAGVMAYRNTGTASDLEFEPYDFDLDLPSMATPIFADLDGDGRVELIAGTFGGGLVYYRQR